MQNYEIGAEAYVKKQHERELAHLQRKAAKLGYFLTLPQPNPTLSSLDLTNCGSFSGCCCLAHSMGPGEQEQKVRTEVLAYLPPCDAQLIIMRIEKMQP